jgi:hypothetical protein
MVLTNVLKVDSAAEDRYLMDVGGYTVNFGVRTIHSSQYQSVLNFMMLLGNLDVIDILPDDEDIWLMTSARIYAKGRRV